MAPMIIIWHDITSDVIRTDFIAEDADFESA